MHIHPAPTHGYLFTLPSPARAGVRLPRYVEPGIVGEMFTQGWLGFPPSKRKHGQASPPTLLRRMPRLRTGWTEADGFAALLQRLMFSSAAARSALDAVLPTSPALCGYLLQVSPSRGSLGVDLRGNEQLDAKRVHCARQELSWRSGQT
eukprot:scaffold6513_cov125-Isochrysis_galbana.AAC.2